MFSVVLRFALLIVCIPAVALGQPTRATPQVTAPSDIDPQLTEEFQRVEQTFWNAAMHNDAETLDRLVAPEFVLRVADLPQGSLPRDIWMANTRSGLQAGSFQIQSSAARKLAEDLAAVNHLVKSTGTINGRDQSCVCYGLDLWKKRNGVWQIIARYNIASDRRRERDAGNRPIPPPTDVDPQLTKTLSRLEQELGGIASRGFNDTKEIDRLIGFEFTLRTSDAPETSVPRALWVQPSGPYKMDSFEERYHAARKLADDLAVVSLLLTQKTSGDRRDQSGDYYVVDIWKQRGGGWQVIARYAGKTFDPLAR